MVARSGGFGGGLNPFGSRSTGGLAGYEIGSDLADYETYLAETGWSNGVVDDATYLAALRKSRDATDPNTQKRAAAENKLSDAEYRIGRSVADKKGLDELIAFDQSAIAKMQPDNVRFRDVDNSLKAELAQRRSRDYGKLVVDYNAGKTSSESLLAWVTSAQKGLTADDPDYDNWQGVAADLSSRIDAERDSKAYQDYQQGRTKPAEFLSYLTKRRDGFDASSPEWDTWNNKLEDATKQVSDKKQSEADQAFFNAYDEGHKSDKQYLAYLHERIKGMKPDDPDLATWQHRLNQAAFSIAEDKLRFAVEQHPNDRGRVTQLVNFYRHYRSTLNPGSAEYRTITRSLDSLAHYGASAGGGGGGGGSRASGSKGTGSATPTTLGGKAIPATTIEGALTLMTINPNADAKSQAAAKKFFDLNYTSMENARQRGDSVFLFFDPRKPGSTVAARNPDGSPALDAKGKPIMTQGTSYLPVSDNAFSQLNMLKANYEYDTAMIALHNHDPKNYALHLKYGLNAQDKARLVDSQATEHSFDQFYQSAQDGIDAAMSTGDWATAMNLSIEVAHRLTAETANPMLDETRRDRLERLGEKLAANPLIPRVDPETGKQTGGAIYLAGSTKNRDGDFASAALQTGWHHVLDSVDNAGGAKWGLAYDNVQDGSWEDSHVKVTTTYGSRVVEGEVTKRSNAGINPNVFVNTDEGMISVPVEGTAQFLSFTDENGQIVKAYSIDGKTWVRSLSGTAPQLEVSKTLSKSKDGQSFVDSDGNKVYELQPGGWKFVGQAGDVAWYGTSDAESQGRLRGLGGTLGRGGAAAQSTFAGSLGFGAFLGALGAGLTAAGSIPTYFGAPGQHMQLVTAGSDGSVSFLSDHRYQAWEEQAMGGSKGGGRRQTIGPNTASGDSRSEGRAGLPAAPGTDTPLGASPSAAGSAGYVAGVLLGGMIFPGAKKPSDLAGVAASGHILEGILMPGVGLGPKATVPNTLTQAGPPPLAHLLPGDTRSEGRVGVPALRTVTLPAGGAFESRNQGVPTPPPALKPLPALRGPTTAAANAALPPVIKPQAPVPPPPRSTAVRRRRATAVPPPKPPATPRAGQGSTLKAL